MSHEIRTPMNGIIGMTALVAAHADEPERVRDSLRKITSSSRHLLSLINEVLDMSKIESGRISLNEEEFSLSALVNDLVVVMQRLAGHGAGFAVCFALRRKEMACKSVHLFVFRAKPAHSLVY